jgi:hypothetical protein
VLKPRHVKPPPEDARLNDVSDITLKWYGPALYFVAIYACPSPNALAPTFESRFARMRHAGGGRFDLAYMQTVEQCLKSIRDDPWFQP